MIMRIYQVMKKLLIFAFLLLNCAAVSAQEEFKFPTEKDYPQIIKSGQEIADFVTKDWKIVDKKQGDLNNDRLDDCALVVKAASPEFLNKNSGLGEDIFDTNPRILIILFKSKTGAGYELAEQSNSFIIAADSPTMAEPFNELTIKNGILQLNFEQWMSAGSWSASNASYKFKYSNGEFILIGADKTDSQRNSGETETRSYNFLTGKEKISTGNFSEDKKDKVVWKTYKLKKLKTLKTFKAPFSWEIEPDFYI